jgi:hypothetical protein
MATRFEKVPDKTKPGGNNPDFIDDPQIEFWGLDASHIHFICHKRKSLNAGLSKSTHEYRVVQAILTVRYQHGDDDILKNESLRGQTPAGWTADQVRNRDRGVSKKEFHFFALPCSEQFAMDVFTGKMVSPAQKEYRFISSMTKARFEEACKYWTSKEIRDGSRQKFNRMRQYTTKGNHYTYDTPLAMRYLAAWKALLERAFHTANIWMPTQGVDHNGPVTMLASQHLPLPAVGWSLDEHFGRRSYKDEGWIKLDRELAEAKLNAKLKLPGAEAQLKSVEAKVKARMELEQRLGAEEKRKLELAQNSTGTERENARKGAEAARDERLKEQNMREQDEINLRLLKEINDRLRIQEEERKARLELEKEESRKLKEAEDALSHIRKEMERLRLLDEEEARQQTWLARMLVSVSGMFTNYLDPETGTETEEEN